MRIWRRVRMDVRIDVREHWARAVLELVAGSERGGGGGEGLMVRVANSDIFYLVKLFHSILSLFVFFFGFIRRRCVRPAHGQ